MKAVLAIASSITVVAVVAFFWASECAGPEPRLVETQLEEPQSEGDPYVVRALIENEGSGKGMVSVEFRLIDAEGRSFVASTTADVEGHEQITVSEEIRAPPSTGYSVEARVDYPVR